jgi:hypothetical protein
MTHEQLIALAKERAKDFTGLSEADVTLEMLPKVRVIEAAVVCFESDEHDGRIQVNLDKDSGEFISGTMTPRNME